MKKVLPFLVFVFVFAGFSAQRVKGETIAIHPFTAENPEIAELVYDVLVMELFMFPVPYSAYSINLDEAPPDVPSGGFPAYVCPSPSLTNGAPYAFTGEIYDDPDFAGSYRFRLYLWEMDGNKLLAYDELTAADRESCEKQMKYLLAWLLSWIDRDIPAEEEQTAAAPSAGKAAVTARPEPVRRAAPGVWDTTGWVFTGPKNSGGETNTTPLDNPDQWVYLGPQGEKWLYLGVRGGMGTSQWYYSSSNPDGGGKDEITNFSNAVMAVQISVNLLRCLDIQTEANFSGEFGSLGDITDGSLDDGGLYFNWSLKVPVLAKLTLRANRLKASLFGGVYVYLPLTQTNADKLGGYFDYAPDFPGYTFGVNIGWRLGPGYLFLDGRLEYDGRWFSSGRDDFYYRSMTQISVGYEIGLLSKRKR